MQIKIRQNGTETGEGYVIVLSEFTDDEDEMVKLMERFEE